MLNNKTIAVVVPAYNEEKQIGIVIETMPVFVDRIIVVNDLSSDLTEEKVKGYIRSKHNHTSLKITKKEISRTFHNDSEIALEQFNKKELDFFPKSEIVNSNAENDRIILINNLVNTGVGGSIARGYKWCKDNNIDCTAVMAGDAQMDPDELESICMPVVYENIDYVKGNRLIHGSAGFYIPKTRFFGNSLLSIFTKIASGYWRVSDTQTGYTAISLSALNSIKLYDIYRSYGMPNDMLVRLNIAYCTIREVPVKPVYRIGEDSKMKIFKVIPKISFLLFRSFFKRLWTKYFLKDFHPLFILYNLSFILGIAWIPYLIKVVRILIQGRNASFETLLAFTFLGITALQFLVFAMWMDIQDNERLYK
ncbi:MAG TPA: glycosyltransferase family 2 protein [Bacteroidales bacterium]|nr:glycosyltransferase [Bacteroidales bacterium]HNR40749.1 glycosyltransferase family 2 protein [Bacteroidales bacterium]